MFDLLTAVYNGFSKFMRKGVYICVRARVFMYVCVRDRWVHLFSTRNRLGQRTSLLYASSTFRNKLLQVLVGAVFRSASHPGLHGKRTVVSVGNLGTVGFFSTGVRLWFSFEPRTVFDLVQK